MGTSRGTPGQAALPASPVLNGVECLEDDPCWITVVETGWVFRLYAVLSQSQCKIDFVITVILLCRLLVGVCQRAEQ